jgi:hypothetical protein
MKHTDDSGKRMRSKKTSGQEEDQSSLEHPVQESNQLQDQSFTFEDAKDALEILIAQIGSHKIRKMHRGRLMGYLILQERRLRTLERRAKNWGYHDETDHCLALAKVWDEGI